MKVLSLFDGISCGQLALNNIGIDVEEYYASEIDKNAISITQFNFPNTIQLGDVNKWKEWDIDWSSIDLLIGGSPCQNLSNAGNNMGLAGDKSSLFYRYVEILNHIKSVNPNVKFLLENVKMKKEWEQIISNELGVKPILINSALVSAQNRERLYWCNWDVTQPKDEKLVLKDIVREEDNNSYFLSYQHWQGFLKSYKWKWCDLDGKSKTLLASYYKQPPHSPYIKCDNSPSGFRMLSPNECELLMTFPLNYTKMGEKEMSKTARYKALGNSWTCKIIEHIFKGLI